MTFATIWHFGCRSMTLPPVSTSLEFIPTTNASALRLVSANGCREASMRRSRMGGGILPRVAALEGQGPITDRSTEYLAPSDRGVTLYRAMLREAMRAVAEGRDPIGVIRDPAVDRLIEFDTHRYDIIPPLREFAAAAE